MIRHNLLRAQNMLWQALSITHADRECLNGHKGKVIWFTGLSGSGKSTLANALEKELHTPFHSLPQQPCNPHGYQRKAGQRDIGGVYP